MTPPKWIFYATAGSCISVMLTILAAGIAGQKMMAHLLFSPLTTLDLPFLLGGIAGAAIGAILKPDR